MCVQEFHQAFNCDIADKPSVPEMDDGMRAEIALFAGRMLRLSEDLHEAAKACGGHTLLMRLHLCQEELAELAQAMAGDDVVGALDALCDMRYVADGTVFTLGLQHAFLEAFFDVHDSNMSKLDDYGKPILNEAGRVIKGPNYRKPRLEQFLR
jgi:predicted HAD superfamily Cof-like phosphohydrolase